MMIINYKWTLTRNRGLFVFESLYIYMPPSYDLPKVTLLFKCGTEAQSSKWPYFS